MSSDGAGAHCPPGTGLCNRPAYLGNGALHADNYSATDRQFRRKKSAELAAVQAEFLLGPGR